MAVQWAHLGAGEVLVASSEGSWIQPSAVGGLGIDAAPSFGSAAQPGFTGHLSLTAPMPHSLAGTEETTRNLLDGAIAAAERAAPRLSKPRLSPVRWAWSLVGQWYCAHHSVALLPEVAERYRASNRPDLAQFALEKLEEERGHDQFSLADLRALGYDAEALVSEVPPLPQVAAAVQYARDCVRGDRPIEFLGYVYALERRVLRLSGDWFSAIEAVLPPGVEAVSGARRHATELDLEHVADAISFFAGLPAGDRTAIAIGCYRTTQISCSSLPGQDPSDAELDRRLSRFADRARASRAEAVATSKETDRDD